MSGLCKYSFRVAYISFPTARPATRYSIQQQRRWVTISSAIHKGLHRDSGQRDGRRSSPSKTERRPRNHGAAPSGDSSRPPWQERGEELGFSNTAARPKPTSPIPQKVEGGSIAPTSRTARQNAPRAGTTRYPLSVPHTTAASEFLYGYSAIYASLRAGRRTCYKLYLHSRGATRDEAAREQASIRSLAVKSGIPIIEGDALDVRLLDKMSNGRPHNGIVLEASPLPILPLQSLATVDTTRNTFVSVRLDGAHTPCRFHNCQPVILLIDDVLDGGNLGAILRSAYFLGIDAVILTSHCAPLNAVALKAGAGAAEALSIFKAQHPAAFLENSRAAGWHVICATTPRQNLRQSMNKSLIVPSSNIRYHMSSLKDVRSINAKFSSSPQIIVVGGEGRGLRKFLTANTDSFLEILAPRDTSSVGLDSLNVSVAAAMVCNEVLTRMRVGENEERYFKHLEENEKSNLHCERPKQTQNEILEREAEDGNGDEFPALESDMGRAEKQAKDAERNS